MWRLDSGAGKRFCVKHAKRKTAEHTDEPDHDGDGTDIICRIHSGSIQGLPDLTYVNNAKRTSGKVNVDSHLLPINQALPRIIGLPARLNLWDANV